jgi:hypothetical protein
MQSLAKAIYLTVAYEFHCRKGGESISREVYLHRMGWRASPSLPVTSMGTLPVFRTES